MQPNALINSLCPILSATQKGNAKFVGSSVLIEIGASRFLVTAAHVLDVNASSTLYIPGKSHWIELIASSSRSAVPKGKRASDLIDVGYCTLSLATVQELATRFSFVPVHALDLRFSCSDKQYYTFSGYPADHVKFNRRVRSTLTKRFTYTSQGLREADVLEIGLNSASHIAVDFRTNAAKDDQGNVVSPPKLKGMSGGAVWILRKDTACTACNPSVDRDND